MGVTANEYGIFLGGEGNVLKLGIGDSWTTCEYTKKHWIVHCKWVNWMPCKLYLKAIGEKSETGDRKSDLCDHCWEKRP